MITKQNESRKFTARQLHRHRLLAAAKAGHDIVKAYDKHGSMAYWELCDKGFGMDEDATDKFIAEIAMEATQ